MKCQLTPRGGSRSPITYNEKGQVFFRENHHYSAKLIEAFTGLNFDQEIPADKLESVIYGDGRIVTGDHMDSRSESSVITINDSSPGPTLVVPENALVTVLVKNEMQERSTTLH